MKRKNKKKPESVNASLPGHSDAPGNIHPPADEYGQACNCAKMREAFAHIAEYARAATCYTKNSHLLGYLYQIEEWAESALSAPPRNCDVGTVEEQAERFHAFCTSNKKCGDVYSCERCQFNAVEDCELAWAQMPYEEGGTK